MRHTAIAGHRGASALVPHENTIEALIRTGEVGAEWVEFDVRRLGDGTLVLVHDADFDGIPLAHMHLAELQDRAAAHGFVVPTLEEALRCCAAHGLHADIELKEVGTEVDAADIARSILRAGQYVYTSFHDRVVAGLKILDPHAPAGLLLGHPDPQQPLLARLTELYPGQRLRACGADFAAPNWRLLRMSFLRRVRASGYPVWVWTVNDRNRLRRLLQAGVSCIITDRPDLAVALRAELQPDAALMEPPSSEAGPQLAIAG